MRSIFCMLFALCVMFAVCLPAAQSQPANPANREYGRTTLIKKKTIATPSNTSIIPRNSSVAPNSSSSSVREYTSRALTKTTIYTGAEYQSYIDNLEKRLSTVQGPEKFLGQVVVTCTINQTGTIGGAKVTKSSQMPQIDAAALKAVQAAGPVAPMPKFRKSPVNVQITFDGTSSTTTTHAAVKTP